MREIKFRVWDVNNKEMLDLEELHYEYEKMSIRTTMYNDYFDIEDMILMQYTGLHDKNGKEIYEGDIVKRLEYSVEEQLHVMSDIGQIKFLEGSYGFYKSKGNMYLFNSLHDELEYGELQYYEVIGNIYENSNLLEVKDE